MTWRHKSSSETLPLGDLALAEPQISKRDPKISGRKSKNAKESGWILNKSYIVK